MKVPISIIIPAHNEQNVLPRTLRVLAELQVADEAQVIVVANGCIDRTAQVAAEFAVEVIELAEGSKSGALNAGDDRARYFPRIYLDADVVLPVSSARAIALALESGLVLACRPRVTYDLRGCSSMVRAYHRARVRSGIADAGLWGGGVYALSAEGRKRFERFPDVAGDDLFIDSIFSGSEKRILDDAECVVRPPQSVSQLIRVMGRWYEGNAGLSGRLGETTSRERLRRLFCPNVDGPRLVDALAYTALVVAGRVEARLRRRRGATGWARDSTTRQ